MSFTNINIPSSITCIPVDTRTTASKVFLLPAANENAGRLLMFKDYYGTASNSTFTISTIGADLIDDVNRAFTFRTTFGFFSLLSDGVNSWRTIGSYNGAQTPAALVSFVPTQISGCLVWTDASTLRLANNASLTTWTNGGTQGTVNCTGTFVQNQLNGYGIVRLTTAQTWTIASQPSLAAHSIFFVSRQTGTTNGRVFQSASGNYLYGYWNSRKNVLFVENNPSFLVGSPSDTAWDLVSYTRTANSAYTFSWNGSLSYSGGTSLNANLPGLTVNTGGSAEPSTCELAEVIVYNSVLTTPQVQLVEGYLAWKWGLNANLPPAHPYKNAPP